MTTGSGRVSLHELTLDDLHVIEPWFSDADTRGWLGDATWPRRLLEFAHRWPARLALTATSEGQIVGLMDVDRYPDGRAAIALTVDPSERHQGIGSAMLLTLVRDSDTHGLNELFGGVEDHNTAGLALVQSAGFEQVTDAPDAAGFRYFARRTDGRRLRHPWVRPLG
jgi:ribosomal protein S18 acetylase RimI-like enzyme